jgi:DNA-binding IclR family transcriptional regulator
MTIQSLVRASDILFLFSLDNPIWGTNDIARAVGLPKTTISSLVRTLAEVGLLNKDSGTQKYRLGIRAFEVGANFLSTSDLYQKSIRKLHELEEKTNMIVRLGIWDRDSVVVIVERSPNFCHIMPPRQLGPRVKSYCTSMGRVFLAFKDREYTEKHLDRTDLIPLTPLTKTSKKEIMAELDHIRKRGYAIVDREVSINHTNIACPIYNADGNIQASISITGDPERIVGEELEELVRILQRAAEDISVSLGYSIRSKANIESHYKLSG